MGTGFSGGGRDGGDGEENHISSFSAMGQAEAGLCGVLAVVRSVVGDGDCDNELSVELGVGWADRSVNWMVGGSGFGCRNNEYECIFMAHHDTV